MEQGRWFKIMHTPRVGAHLKNRLGLGGLLAFYLLLEPQVTNITSFKLFQPWRTVFMTAYHPVIDDITVNNFGTCI